MKIGELVYDYNSNRWGYVAKIGNEPKAATILPDETDKIILLVEKWDDENWISEWETFAEDVYQIAERKSYKGEIVCYEHNDVSYPYFCPKFNENLYHFEVD